MKEDNWNHRTQFEEHDSVRTESITEEVELRRHGKVHVPQPSDSSRQEDEDENDEYDDPADYWADQFPHHHD